MNDKQKSGFREYEEIRAHDIAEHEELGVDYVAKFNELKEEISNLSAGERTERLAEIIQLWTTPMAQDIVNEGTDIALFLAKQEARENNPAFHQFIERLRSLQWEQANQDTLPPPQAPKINWIGNEDEIIGLFLALQEGRRIQGFEDENHVHNWKFISDHFLNKRGNPFSATQLASVYNQGPRQGKIEQAKNKYLSAINMI